VSVCRISQKRHVQTSRNVLLMLPVVVARFCSDDNELCTSGFVDDVIRLPIMD